MNSLPRLALAMPATGSEPSIAALAWLAGLSTKAWQVQHFRSRACPTTTETVGQVGGLPGRHLDAWLMPEDVLRSVFLKGAKRVDLALVEGTLDNVAAFQSGPPYDQPGSLSPIIEALNLPTVAVLESPRRESFHLPHVPVGADAVFLDGLESASDFEFFRRMITLATRKPVIGAVEAIPEVREAIREAPRYRPLPEALVEKLGESFLRFADLGMIRSLSRSRHWEWEEPEPVRSGKRRFRVAYAQDAAFGAYFPDTLEALESLGADLVEFSPIRDEHLPDRVDLVMIGCGFPDLHADALSRNLSLIGELRGHVCRGQRIYSEGGGTAYLGRSMVMGDRRVPGAGILPFDAILRVNPAPPAPVSRIISRDCWLGPAGTEVRGYKSGRWELRPGADPLDCPGCFGSLTIENDIYFRHHALGGLIHLYLAARPEVVAAFASPHAASLTLPTGRPCP